ncbi:MAG: ABC transporter ATP-binding protein [Gammaproteobacteria bacterium]
MNDDVLEVGGLHVQFPELGRTVQAVRGASLQVRRGEVMGLVGESGCGKTLTALACLGLVPPPGQVAGTLSIDGFDVIGRSEADLVQVRGGLAAMIFQNPGKALNPFFTLGRQITDVLRRHRKLSAHDARGVAAAALESVHLPDAAIMLDKYPHQLSGGQLQRAMIAMALACEPQLLIADEPTTALDVTIQGQVIVLLRELATSQGLSILFITHDLALVGVLCDRVSVMYAGVVVEVGTVAEVFETPRHPYTEKLLQTVPRLGTGRAELAHIPGQVPDMARPPPGCAFHPRCQRASEACIQSAPAVRIDNVGHGVACHHASAV